MEKKGAGGGKTTLPSVRERSGNPYVGKINGSLRSRVGDIEVRDRRKKGKPAKGDVSKLDETRTSSSEKE